jgi:hypothetical protein
MYFAVQNYAVGNPRPYDDTGWTFQFMRNIKLLTVTDKAIQSAAMEPITGDAKAAGGISGTGSTIVVEHTSDNNLMAFRMKFASTKMAAAEEDFAIDGKTLRAGALIIASGDRNKIDASLKDLGLTGYAVATAPTVKSHDLDIPRIGYAHAWQRTQDEGWVRAALDTYGVPYTYFADQKFKEGNLRAKYDVIIYPHVGGSPISHVNGIAKGTGPALPYKKSDATPNLGVNDQSDDIRGGMGMDGLLELQKFVQQGGTLIVEGSTATIFPTFGITSGITVESPSQLFVRGSVMRGIISDKKSPISYGFDGSNLPVYFNQDPVLNAGGGGVPAELAGFLGGGAQIPGVGQNVTPMATPLRLSQWEPDSANSASPATGGDAEALRQMARAFGIGGNDDARPRVVMQFPTNPNDMLLSGTLAGGQALAGRAQVVDAKVGEGHVVLFAIRPFWRWQTQGNFFLGFNAILNWNDLDAGKPEPAKTPQK